MLKALVADIQSHFRVHTLPLSRAVRLSVVHSLAFFPAKPHPHPDTCIVGKAGR